MFPVRLFLLETEYLFALADHAQLVAGDVLDQGGIAAVGDILRQLGVFLLQLGQALRIRGLLRLRLLNLRPDRPELHHDADEEHREDQERQLAAGASPLFLLGLLGRILMTFHLSLPPAERPRTAYVS